MGGMTQHDITEVDTPVLVVGGGPVGLGLAIELGRSGIPVHLIEMRDGSVTVPKMSQVHARSLEICRRWGVSEQVYEEGFPRAHPHDFIYVTTLVGHELLRIKRPSFNEQPRQSASPERDYQCPQLYFDPILRRLAETMAPVKLRYFQRLDGFHEDADRVVVDVTDIRTGKSSRLSCRYLVGCDGAQSTVRQQLGIAMGGAGRLDSSVSIFFRSPELATLHDKGWGRFYRFNDQGGCWSEMVAINGNDLWRLTILTGLAPDAPFDAQACLLRAIGCTFPHEIISVNRWDRLEFVANEYRRGRVFIAGDAAHQNSPTGGLGMNTGLADAFDLGWKLAAVLQGWGGERLLCSYDAERRPVAMRNAAECSRLFQDFKALPGNPLLDANGPLGDEARRLYSTDLNANMSASSVTEQVKLGFCYENSPVICPDGTQPLPTTGRYVPSTRPGTRAPHCWLPDGRSIIDLYGDAYTLLRFGPAAPDGEPLAAAAALRKVPFRTVAIPASEVSALYERPLVLVRPDGHVCWRGERCPADPLAVIDRVRGA